MLLHAENTVIPNQVVIYSPKGTNNTVKLLFDTSIYDLKQKQMLSAEDLTVKDGLRLFTPAAALSKVPEAFFARHPIEAQVVLQALRIPLKSWPGFLRADIPPSREDSRAHSAASAAQKSPTTS